MNTSLQFSLPFPDMNEEQSTHFPIYSIPTVLESFQKFVEYQFLRVQAHEQQYKEKYLQEKIHQNELNNYLAYITEDQIVSNGFLEALKLLEQLQEILLTKKHHTRNSTIGYLAEWQSRNANDELPADQNVLNNLKGRRPLKQATVEAFAVLKKAQLTQYEIESYLIQKFGIKIKATDKDSEEDRKKALKEANNLSKHISTCLKEGILKKVSLGIFELDRDNKHTQKYLNKIQAK